ncbi:aggregation promoting factor surface protein [Apilactobacillus bombintestini]|uniref:Aggregation promoting factor surface protein n=1 Tax=Apilactobacillus bombintestini TaxID=2419772 RepID=A0A387ASD2_9LACO|nr:aggregation promoting factor surface protein [Apilactobacillus bombintestini]AYF92125.1 aggregation promoting factor surface protein [Apilactobacillus bombintestini]
MRTISQNIVKFTVIAVTSFLMLFALNIANNNVSASAAGHWQHVAERKLSKKQIRARRWVSFHESTNRYHVRNGICYGKFQLNEYYLHGNHSKKNQELTANRYVKHRYGTWVKAKHFWQRHHWY